MPWLLGPINYFPQATLSYLDVAPNTSRVVEVLLSGSLQNKATKLLRGAFVQGVLKMASMSHGVVDIIVFTPLQSPPCALEDVIARGDRGQDQGLIYEARDRARWAGTDAQAAQDQAGNCPQCGAVAQEAQVGYRECGEAQ